MASEMRRLAVLLSTRRVASFPSDFDPARSGERLRADTLGVVAVEHQPPGEIDLARKQQVIRHQDVVAGPPEDDIDWADEVRIAIEERVSMSPDALTGMEANLRFNGPENMATRIFGRLTAWQNWIFQRPNAVGDKGALKVYGSGAKAKFNWERV